MTLAGLNTDQFNAVISRSPAVLVIASAGSGKTKTLTTRIAYLIKKRKVSPYNVLALTFTRKAANEMKERLTAMVGEQAAKNIMCGTFHAVSLKMLNQYGFHLGYQKGITIYDEIDQADIVASIIGELGSKVEIKEVLASMHGYASDCDNFEFEKQVSAIVTEYRNRLKEWNAVDFTLLLTETLRLIREFPDVFEYYHNRLQHVFIDEYQDTDRTQFYLHEAIKPNNIFVVGDDYQAIYGWRGSLLEIILNFASDHKDAEIIKLEQSYRCGASILEHSNNLISYNTDQYKKSVWTERDAGSFIVQECEDNEEEAKWISRKIVDYLSQKDKYSPKDFVILARTHRQHEAISAALAKKEIPYKEIGKECNYWKRTSARTIVSVLKVLHNTKNKFHFGLVCRTILYPMSAEEYLMCEARALQNRKSIVDMLIEERGGVFAELLNWYAENKTEPLNVIIEKVVDTLKIEEYYLRQSLITKGMEVLQAKEYAKKWCDENEDGRTVADFLSWLAEEEVQTEINDDNAVKIATIHAYKGLESRVVFVAGLVEGKLPSKPAIKNNTVTEERRLAYVAMTRAIETLILTTYKTEIGFRSLSVQPSRFLKEMEKADGNL